LGGLYIRHGASNSFIADFVELTSIEMLMKSFYYSDGFTNLMGFK